MGMTIKEAMIIVGNIPIVADDCFDICQYQEAKAMAIEALENNLDMCMECELNHCLRCKYQDKCAKHLKYVVKELKEKQQKWIPVSERFPFDFQIVNVTWINRNPEPYYEQIKGKPFVASAVFYKGKWYWYSSTCVDYLKEYGKAFDLIDKDIDIVAWMPLPEPYKEEGAE